MKVKGILLAIIILILCIQMNAEYEEKCFIDKANGSFNRSWAMFSIDRNKGYLEIVLNWANVELYGIRRKYKITKSDSLIERSIFGYSDTDEDGKFEFAGIEVPKLILMEQDDSLETTNNITWESDTMFEGVDWLGVGDIKGDGITRIYGAGIPEISDEVYRYGWFYMDCTGDNQYEIGGRVSPSTKSRGAIDVGDVNGDGQNDVIFSSHEVDGVIFFEFNEVTDSFERMGAIDSLQCEKVLFFPDVDKDGKNEIMRCATEYLLPPYYHFKLYEIDSLYNYELIWDYYWEGTTDYMFLYGCDISYGDVDNDGDNEFVVCGGSTMRVFDVTGDNTFTEVYTKTIPDNLFLESNVKCYDFDFDGQDEILFAGQGSELLERGMFIYKDEVISELWMEDTLDFGNQSVIDTITAQVAIKSVDTYDLIVDSVKVEGIRYKKSSEPTYPITLVTNDSMLIEVEYECIDTGISLGRLIAYSNDHYGGVDTMEIKGGLNVECIIDSIVATDGAVNIIPGVDSDDTLVAYFNYKTNCPAITKENIDSILILSEGHKWVDNVGQMKGVYWSSDSLRLIIKLATYNGVPTVEVGDTVYGDNNTIKEIYYSRKLYKPVVITGSFGPAGIENPEPCAVGCEPKMQMQSQYIVWNTTTQGTLTVYDISGREVIREESKASGTHKTDIRQLKNGIYFIKLKTENESITKKQIIIR
ncbi:MAG: T9SS type A sorting domain-containing protein [bacterium]|nr:T9SS type A sorting domain-containing protein [bacterium]